MLFWGNELHSRWKTKRSSAKMPGDQCGRNQSYSAAFSGGLLRSDWLPPNHIIAHYHKVDLISTLLDALNVQNAPLSPECKDLLILAHKSGGELRIRAELTRLSVCVHFICVYMLQMCVRKTSHTALDCSTNNPEILKCSPCAFRQSLYLVLPDTWDWTRMHALVVMHRRTLYENVDSAKIKLFYLYLKQYNK